MTQKRKYELISERENWTLPFFKASSGFCPFYSPSIFESGAALAHGLDLRGERQYRILIIQYMFECGEWLSLPYNTICIAIIYFHKFFASISIRAHDPYFISTSCLYTAGKQEETRIRLDKCARFLFQYKHKRNNPPKKEIDRICKKLCIAELLCTQINKFYYNMNLPFDYLLPIVSQWKSVYIPHQTNTETLKYIYTLHAFKFIQQSFYIPIHIIVPPQKIAIVCMELSLRLNYEKYRQQQEDTTTTTTDDKYRYIDPPLQWFRIFDVGENEQDLKDEIHLLCNEIINAVQDVDQFGTEKDIERCKMWRKNTLKMDSVHKEIIEEQMAHDKRLLNKNTDGHVMYNMCKQLESKELLSSSSNSMHNTAANTTQLAQHRQGIHAEAETSLAANNEAISPASLQPHKYLNLYPLKEQCFEDVDKEYELKQKEKKEDHKRHRKHSHSKKKKKKRRRNRSSDEAEEEEEENGDNNECEEERKSNAIKTKTSRKKRKRSETETHSEHDKEREKRELPRKKRRRIIRDKSSKKYNQETEKDASDHANNNDSSRHRTHHHSHRSRKDRKSRKRSSSSDSSRHREKEKDKERKRSSRSHKSRKRSASPIDLDKRDREQKKKRDKKIKKNEREKYHEHNSNSSRYKKKREKKNHAHNNSNNHIIHNNNNNNANTRYTGGYFTKPNPYKGLAGANFNEMTSYYHEDHRNQQVFDENAHFDYGLTPTSVRKGSGLRDGHESGECTDDQLRQLLLSNRSNGSFTEFNEEKTQRNEQEPVSPLLKALKSNNKSALYTNMLLPSRRKKDK
eukprot:169265_1